MDLYEGESIYIAGPECFYARGAATLGAMRKKAESCGFSVSLPNDRPLKLDNEDLRKNADAIFVNCLESMKASTAIIADLEQFRGSEADSGTIYELGMAYALGIRRYAFTRDKRDMVFKHQAAFLAGSEVLDSEGRRLPYPDLPFSPTIVGSTKIVEGDFDDCLRIFMLDLDEERKATGRRPGAVREDPPMHASVKRGRPIAYVSGSDRYSDDCEQKYREIRRLCSELGVEAVVPTDPLPEVPVIASDDPYARAYNTFDRYQSFVRKCDFLIADLGDFHGWEPANDTAFECGMAFTLGKRCYGYMPDTTIMRKRIPHYGEERDFRDIYGNNVENFNYPINLMFASSMPIFEGRFEDIFGKVVDDFVKNRRL